MSIIFFRRVRNVTLFSDDEDTSLIFSFYIVRHVAKYFRRVRREVRQRSARRGGGRDRLRRPSQFRNFGENTFPTIFHFSAIFKHQQNDPAFILEGNT
jgi:hypothetical protein